MESASTPRQPLLKAIAGGAIALGAVATASKVALSPDGLGSPAEGLPALELSADGGSDVRSLEVELGDALLPRVAANRWGTSRLTTSTHSMVAFTWRRREADPHIEVNSRVAGSWQGWRQVAHLHDMPDADSGEEAGVLGTELVWIGDADVVGGRLLGYLGQVRRLGPAGSTPGPPDVEDQDLPLKAAEVKLVAIDGGAVCRRQAGSFRSQVDREPRRLRIGG